MLFTSDAYTIDQWGNTRSPLQPTTNPSSSYEIHVELPLPHSAPYKNQAVKIPQKQLTSPPKKPPHCSNSITRHKALDTRKDGWLPNQTALSKRINWAIVPEHQTWVHNDASFDDTRQVEGYFFFGTRWRRWPVIFGVLMGGYLESGSGEQGAGMQDLICWRSE